MSKPAPPSVDLSKAVNYAFPKERVTLNSRDAILYALGIGLNAEEGPELRYTYELSPDFSVFPTYPLVLALKGDSSDVNLFSERAKTITQIPGIPKFDLNRLVHGEQSLLIHRPLPSPKSAEFSKKQFYLQTIVDGVYDKGSGMVIVTKVNMTDEANVLYAELTGSSFVRGYGGFGGDKGPKGPNYTPPARAPDAVVRKTIAPYQALLYRLSGDYNPLHADPAIARKVGFKKPILHGLCTFGHAAAAIVNTFCNGDGAQLLKIQGRFSAPVYTGQTLEIHLWRQGQEVIYVVKVAEGGADVLQGAASLVGGAAKL